MFKKFCAPASLGQVYKGVLKETGETVAVKVQRPYVLETVTIDLFIIRKLGVFLRRFPQVSLFMSFCRAKHPFISFVPSSTIIVVTSKFTNNTSPQIATDVVGLVDEWAARFFEELDYVREGQNGTRFAEMMRADLPQVGGGDTLFYRGLKQLVTVLVHHYY